MSIYALSSGPGISGVAVIRISGLETKDIIEKLTKLLKDEQMSENMGKEGAKFVREKFNWEIVAKNFLDIIRPYLKK